MKKQAGHDLSGVQNIHQLLNRTWHALVSAEQSANTCGLILPTWLTCDFAHLALVFLVLIHFLHLLQQLDHLARSSTE